MATTKKKAPAKKRSSLIVPAWNNVPVVDVSDCSDYEDKWQKLRKLEAGSSHYAINMRPRLLARWSILAAKLIVEQFGKNGEFENKIPAFVYRGSSGVAVATALSQALVHQDLEFVFGMIYTRKEEEKSHGGKLEVYNEAVLKEAANRVVFIFVDDFVATGATFRAAINAVKEACENHTQSWERLTGVTFAKSRVRLLLTEIIGEDAVLTEWKGGL